ncbi:hypothetical protein ETB97_012264, partial [Aspergillus alliaceus]
MVMQYFYNNATDSQATLFKDDRAKELIIAFRGTSTPKDLDTDFRFTLVPLTVSGTKCPTCQVHQGFQDAYMSLGDDITSALKTQLNRQPRYSITVTGHSLGGAMAAIASASLAALGYEVTTYTFGEPRNGDAAFARYLSGLMSDHHYYRVTHFNDGVPQIPPAILGYQHHGPEYWETSGNQNDASTTISCGIGSTSCNSAQKFGQNPINRAHLT